MQPLTKAESKILSDAKTYQANDKSSQRLLCLGTFFVTVCALMVIILYLLEPQKIDEHAICQMTFSLLICAYLSIVFLLGFPKKRTFPYKEIARRQKP